MFEEKKPPPKKRRSQLDLYYNRIGENLLLKIRKTRSPLSWTEHNATLTYVLPTSLIAIDPNGLGLSSNPNSLK